MGLVTVYSGAQRRREWSDDEKLALVAAAFANGAKVAEVARRAEVSASLLYRWRRQLGRDAPAGFTPVAIGTMPVEAPAAPVIVVEAGKARVEIMKDASPALVSAALGALRR